MKQMLYTCLAMSAMFGMEGISLVPEKRYNSPPPKKLSPEEIEKEIEKRKAQFLLDLEQNNVDRKKNFPNWKEYIVYDLVIIASNPKNAVKNMHSLMHKNHLAIKVNQ